MPELMEKIDTSQTVWKYMDFDKFIYLLATSNLWLTPLVELEDKREGNWCKFLSPFDDPDLRDDPNLIGYLVDLDDPAFDRIPDILNDPDLRNYFASRYDSDSLDDLGNFFEFVRRQTAVFCWSLSDKDSLYMWDLYTTPGKGVAITSTIEGLSKSNTIAQVGDLGLYQLRLVKYSDEPVPITLMVDTPYPLLDVAEYKSMDFSHEKEVRCVFSRRLPELNERYTEQFSKVPPMSGMPIAVDLETLLKEIYISPRAAPWLYECVTNTLDAFGQKNVPVHRSSISQHFIGTYTPN